MKIVFIDKSTLTEDVNLTKPNFPHQWIEYNSTSADQTLDRVKDADIIVTNKVVLNEEIIRQCRSLKLIAVVATGYNIIDTKTCNELNIPVCNVHGYAKNTVTEHTFSLIFHLTRSIASYQKDIQQGRWQKSEQFCFLDYPIKDITEKTIGIIGAGTTGLAVANIAKSFDMNVLLHSRTPKECEHAFTSLNDLYEKSDIISVHCPLTPETENLITLNEFQTMKKQPIIINCARGGIVNEEDAVTAIKNSLISGLGFDCLTQEPPTKGNPILDIVDQPNVIITPHVAWASQQAIQLLWDGVINNINAFQQGKPKNIVNEVI